MIDMRLINYNHNSVGVCFQNGLGYYRSSTRRPAISHVSLTVQLPQIVAYESKLKIREIEILAARVNRQRAARIYYGAKINRNSMVGLGLL